jgi:hypothetical protein
MRKLQDFILEKVDTSDILGGGDALVHQTTEPTFKDDRGYIVRTTDSWVDLNEDGKLQADKEPYSVCRSYSIE